MATKIRHFNQTFVVLKLFFPQDRSSICFEDGGLLLVLRTRHDAALFKCSQPRTSDNSIWASRIVAGPYFSALLPGACHFLTFCCIRAWNNSFGFASIVALRWWYYNLNPWHSKLLMYRRIIVLHVNDLLQVVFAARFIWRQHSNTKTIRFQWKTWDLFFLEITRFCGRRNASPSCVINMKIFFNVWNLIKFKEQKNH